MIVFLFLNSKLGCLITRLVVALTILKSSLFNSMRSVLPANSSFFDREIKLDNNNNNNNNNPLAFSCSEGTKRDALSICELLRGRPPLVRICLDVACTRTELRRIYTCNLFTKMHRCMNEMNGETQELNDCKRQLCLQKRRQQIEQDLLVMRQNPMRAVE